MIMTNEKVREGAGPGAIRMIARAVRNALDRIPPELSAVVCDRDIPPQERRAAAEAGRPVARPRPDCPSRSPKFRSRRSSRMEILPDLNLLRKTSIDESSNCYRATADVTRACIQTRRHPSETPDLRILTADRLGFL